MSDKTGSRQVLALPVFLFDRLQPILVYNQSMLRLFFCLLFFKALTALALDPAGLALHVSGEAEKIHQGNKTPLFKGDSLYPLDKIVTKAKALVIVQLPPNATLKILEKTEITLESLMSDAKDIRLEDGGVLLRLKKELGKKTGELTVHAKRTSMGVRGTEFFVSSAQDKLWMCVHEGSVEVARGAEKKLVTEGLGVAISEGTPLETPKFYPWTKNIAWNFDQDKVTESESQSPTPRYQDLLDFDYD